MTTTPRSDTGADVESTDVIVLGSGAAGLTAALTARIEGADVVVLEKGDLVGGTSAWSGGALWIPVNPKADEAGLDDSREDALAYIASLSNGMIDPAMAEVFVDTGAEMVEYLEANTPMAFELVPGFPDYQPEQPGGKPRGGRSLQAALFPFDQLGEWRTRVTVGRQLGANAAGVSMALSETPLGHTAPDGVPPAELARRQEHDERGMGQALVGRLLKGLLDRGVEPRVEHRAVRLVVEDGRVVGVTATTPGGEVELRARRGVVLATGGFEWDPELVRAFLRGPLERPVSVPTNTGDGLRMAMRIGVSLGTMREAWWTATIDVPDQHGRTIPWMVNGERTRPRTIMVNRDGKRFANESANYNAFGAAFHQIDPVRFDYSNLPAWMVFDRGYVERYGLGTWRGDGPTPSWITVADSLADLASDIGIDPTALEDTVARWNANVADGHDPDFHRGESAHDQWWGDPALTGSTAASLGPLDTAPFHAVRVYPAALGTKGGPRTTADAQVLDVDGDPVPGLYAAGNAAASVFGMTYGGAGGTLGPACVFGYRAGRHLTRSA
ncbi:FAD-dependent oxidoreductase [Euzebya rosea]|uniref:FAD-dependent oxidoreductase n=1 Tax=Euzebya rosea TaxID=2052804 RepID=UPI000D3E23FE|nr:FAD-dependent oxidoreductase [Euzebya rosea]